MRALPFYNSLRHRQRPRFNAGRPAEGRG